MLCTNRASYSHALLSDLLKDCTWNLVVSAEYNEHKDMANNILETHQYLQPWTISNSGLYFPFPTIQVFELCTINILIEPTSETCRAYSANSWL